MGNLPMSWASASGRIIARAVSVPDLVMRTAGYDGATEASVQQSAAVPSLRQGSGCVLAGRNGGGCFGPASRPRLVTGAPEGPLDWFSRSWRRGRIRLQVAAEEQQAADLDGGRVRSGAGGDLHGGGVERHRGVERAAGGSLRLPPFQLVRRKGCRISATNPSSECLGIR